MACWEGAPGLRWQRQHVGPQANDIDWCDHRKPFVVYFVIKPPASGNRTAKDIFFSLDDLLRALRHRRQ